jgi:predicted alpha-1,2-mannosidase
MPGLVPDFVHSLLLDFRDSGILPIWPLWGYETGTMSGVPSFQVLSEAIVIGLGGSKERLAYDAMISFVNSSARFLEYDRQEKFIPIEVSDESVSHGLELSIGIASLARAAEHIGDKNHAFEFHRRARNYRKYWDFETGFFCGRFLNGSFRSNFTPFSIVDFTEGNAFSYLFLVPHDVTGLIDLLGGEINFSTRFDEFISTPMGQAPIDDLGGLIGQYAHGNEHSHHVFYLHAYVGAQWRTAELVSQVLFELYNERVDGLIGNDDCGQMSAWYVFSVIGFYPVFAPSLEYVFGSPSIESVTLRLENGKIFQVRTIKSSDRSPYIQSVTLNGFEYTRAYIRHETIMAGGQLIFRMDTKPNKSFGANVEDRPHSSLE